jgi:hypothetical protein
VEEDLLHHSAVVAVAAVPEPPGIEADGREPSIRETGELRADGLLRASELGQEQRDLMTVRLSARRDLNEGNRVDVLTHEGNMGHDSKRQARALTLFRFQDAGPSQDHSCRN